jgi:dTDP-L-rhamnose 4-epimerase
VKVLVTGAAGFIGSHIVDTLRSGGHTVIGLDSLDPAVHHAPPSYLRDDVEYCFADLRHWRPDARFDDVESVVHLAALGGVARAAREPENVLSANCGGTAKLLETARGWPKLRTVVLASSFSVYGSNYAYRCVACGAVRDGARTRVDLEAGRFEVVCRECGSETAIVPIDETATPNPLEVYGASKYMQELCWRGFENAPVHVMRFSSAYGPRLRVDDGEATIIAKLIGWIASDVRPNLFEDGCQIRDWVYVGDIVCAALSLIEADAAGRTINVCSGTPMRLSEACAAIASALGVDVTPNVVGGFRPGDMRHCLGDAASLRALIGRPPVPFRDGIRLTLS